MNRIERELKEKGTNNYNAHFACSLSLYIPETQKIHSFEGKLSGKLTFPGRGTEGFGYDPIFIPEGYNQTYAEIGNKVKNTISHRAIAFKQFINWIKENEK